MGHVALLQNQQSFSTDFKHLYLFVRETPYRTMCGADGSGDPAVPNLSLKEWFTFK